MPSWSGRRPSHPSSFEVVTGSAGDPVLIRRAGDRATSSTGPGLSFMRAPAPGQCVGVYGQAVQGIRAFLCTQLWEAEYGAPPKGRDI